MEGEKKQSDIAKEPSKTETKTKEKPKGGTTKRNTIIALCVTAALVSYLYRSYLDQLIDPDLAGDDLYLRIPLDEQTKSQRDRWNASVPFSFPGSTTVPVIKFNQFNPDFIDGIITKQKMLLIKEAPFAYWPAFEKWKDIDYLRRVMPSMIVHSPNHPVVRMHHLGQANMLGKIDGVNWTRPWEECEVDTRVFYKGDKLAYFMGNIKNLPSEMDMDFGVTRLTVPYSPPMEINVWMGVPSVTTPAHYDLVHNFYTQVVGQKRFILFPPEDAPYLHTFPSLHPSARMSQIDFDDPKSWEIYPEMKNLHPKEVVLNPGDVLYIPPMYFHYVCVAGESISMSVSTHTESSEATVYERSYEGSSKFFSSFWNKYKLPGVAWNVSSKSVVLREYVRGLFVDDETAAKEIKILIDSHWNHFKYDKGAIGLDKIIETGREKYPSDDQISKIKLTGRQIKRIKAASDEIRRMFEQEEIKASVRIILMQTHIEELTGLVIGPLNADPFLRYFDRYLSDLTSSEEKQSI